MKYLPRSRAGRSYSKLAVVFLAGVILIYFARPILVPLVSPLWKAENIVTRNFARGFEFLRSKGALIEENAALKDRVSSLEIERSALSAALSQEEAILSIIGEDELRGILASVLARPPQIPYDFLIVDAGFNKGVMDGYEVYMPEGPKLGVVAEALSSQTRVKLFTSSGEKTNAVLERYGVSVVLEGVGGGNFRIKVPRETEVAVGDKILSADLEGSLLAVVGDILLRPTDSFKEVLARSPLNIFSTRFLIIKP